MGKSPRSSTEPGFHLWRHMHGSATQLEAMREGSSVKCVGRERVWGPEPHRRHAEFCSGHRAPPECSLEGLTSKLKLWPPDVKSWLLCKDPDAGKDWRQEEKGTTEDELVRWHHRLDGHEFEQAPELVMDREAWRAAVHRVAESQTRLSWTELNRTELCTTQMSRDGQGASERVGLEWRRPSAGEAIDHLKECLQRSRRDPRTECWAPPQRMGRRMRPQQKPEDRAGGRMVRHQTVKPEKEVQWATTTRIHRRLRARAGIYWLTMAGPFAILGSKEQAGHSQSSFLFPSSSFSSPSPPSFLSSSPPSSFPDMTFLEQLQH